MKIMIFTLFDRLPTRVYPNGLDDVLELVQKSQIKFAEHVGAHYEFVENTILPNTEFISRHKINVRSNYYRLIKIREYLDQGYDRVIYLDADLLIVEFDRYKELILNNAYGFGSEVWFNTLDSKFKPRSESYNVTNSIVMYSQENRDLQLKNHIEYVESVIKRPKIAFGISGVKAVIKLYTQDESAARFTGLICLSESVEQVLVKHEKSLEALMKHFKYTSNFPPRSINISFLFDNVDYEQIANLLKSFNWSEL